MGSHVLAGTYHGKAAIRASRFLPLVCDLRDGSRVRVTHLTVLGSTAVVEFETVPSVSSRKPCRTSYCWIMRIAGAQVVEVRAYVDPALIFHFISATDAATD